MAELKPFDINELKSVEVSLASPATIRGWSCGEVTKPETINYRTQKPEPEGLFCEKIFGPSKDYTCRCGKYTKKQHAGIICEKCGVEVTVRDVRRERMGHIELATPCTHIWFLKGASSSTIGRVLEVQLKPLQEVVYYNAYICLNPGQSKLIKYKDVLTETYAKSLFIRVIKEEIMPKLNEGDYDYSRAEHFLGVLDPQANEPFDFASVGKFISRHLGCEFGDGAAAIKRLLQEVDIDEEYTKIIAEIGSHENIIGYDLDGVDNADEIQLIKDHLLSLDSVNKAYLSRDGKNLYVELKDLNVDLLAEIKQLLPNNKISLKKFKKAENQKLTNLVKRLGVVSAFKKSGNKPEWMVLDVLPVIPPSLRPMTQIGGKFVTSDLNDLYRKVIIRNNRLKRDIEQNSPSIILDNDKRILQNAVDSLLDNSRCAKPAKGPGGREYKSLTSALKGKPGRFRQNLLGKRVDFSGRSVIAVGPDLRMYQCGLPREMAIQLLRPFIEQILFKTPAEGKEKSVQNGYGMNFREAKNLIDTYDPIVHGIVERIIGEHPVLLNRAPTLHRLGIQAFQPKLVDGRAIRLHPLVCKGFNADFDGDQMAVHVPLSKAAQKEAIDLMLASNNILGPKNGKPIAVPSQDMILGNYYLTLEEDAEEFTRRAKRRHDAGLFDEEEKFILYAASEGKVFTSIEEVVIAYETRQVHIHNRIAIPGSKIGKDLPKPSLDMTQEDWEKVHKIFGDISYNEYKDAYEGYLLTTVGKVLFNKVFPTDFPYVNDPSKVKEGTVLVTSVDNFVKRGTDIRKAIKSAPLKSPVKKKQLEQIVGQVFQRYESKKTSAVLDAIKDNGFAYSTKAGFTIALSDIKVTQGKEELLKASDEYVEKLNEDYEWGLISDKRRSELVVNRWKQTTEQIQKKTVEQLKKDTRNPVFMIFDSGARGNEGQFNQMLGIRGVMANPKGEAIEIPIKSCFREGLTISEFFISTHGGRKGVTDTALKTAESGYLTRRLVDVAQDIVVRSDDCHADHGFVVRPITSVDFNGQIKTIVSLEDRLIGRYAAHDVVHPETGEVIVRGTIGREYEDFKDEIISKDKAHEITAAGIKEVEIRSVLCCKTKDGVCKTCYGMLVATNSKAQIGDAVGIMAGQSIGEPGTQLTMRTFHSGGVAGDDIVQGLPRVQELVEARKPKRPAIISHIDGKVVDVSEDSQGRFTFVIKNEDGQTETYESGINTKPVVASGDVVVAGQQLTAGSIDLRELLDCAGKEKVQDYILAETLKVYAGVGELISDKHIEIIIRQMFSKVTVENGYDTGIMPGLIDKVTLDEANKEAIQNGLQPAVSYPVIKGIKDIAKQSASFLSAASFQETTAALTNAAINHKVDVLHGLKENVIVGKLIPAGTGLLSEKEVEELTKDFSTIEEIDKIAREYK